MIDKKVIRFKVNQFIHKLSEYKETVWIIGSGRSGTTWVSDLINHEKKYREIYEPFHPVKEKFLLPHRYTTPTNIDRNLSNLIDAVFSGKFLTMRTDKANEKLFYESLLIKDIFANLLAFYAHTKFPEVKIIFLIRNPFAVALSKFKTKSWYWMKDPIDFLSQKELREDFLLPYEQLIKEISKKGDFIEKHLLVWSIINFVPLIQFDLNKICVVFYEDVVLNPMQELKNMNSFINPGKNKTEINVPEKIIATPSRVTGKESSFDISGWKNLITPSQINSGNKILEQFGLNYLYNSDSTPNRQELINLKSAFKNLKV